jgi:hypothetical protein
MKKRGQFQLSFGMIFSILIIIAIIATAFYVISKFLSTSKCTEIAIFHDDFKDYIDKAWRSTIHQDTFSGTLPQGIKEICFGDLSQNRRPEIERAFINTEGNVFLYPPEQACDSAFRSVKLDHVEIPEFFCKKITKNKITIKTSKTQFDSLVKISE